MLVQVNTYLEMTVSFHFNERCFDRGSGAKIAALRGKGLKRLDVFRGLVTAPPHRF